MQLSVCAHSPFPWGLLEALPSNCTIWLPITSKIILKELACSLELREKILPSQISIVHCAQLYLQACIYSLLLCECLRVTIAVMKHHDQSTLERKGFILSLCFYIPVHHWRKPGQEVKWQEPRGRSSGGGGVLLTGLLLLACTACFFIYTWATCQRVGITLLELAWGAIQPDLWCPSAMNRWEEFSSAQL